MACQFNLVLYGPVDTGKTHLAVALGRLACMRAIPVGFFTATGLLMRLRRAKRGARRGAPADRQGEAPGHRRVRLHADRPHRAPRKAHRIRGRLLPQRARPHDQIAGKERAVGADGAVSVGNQPPTLLKKVPILWTPTCRNTIRTLRPGMPGHPVVGGAGNARHPASR